jgi:hypothetical protein
MYALVPTKIIWAIQNNDIEIPCDISPPVINDQVKLVLWFKDSDVAMYSLDTRKGGSIKNGKFLYVFELILQSLLIAFVDDIVFRLSYYHIFEKMMMMMIMFLLFFFLSLATHSTLAGAWTERIFFSIPNDLREAKLHVRSFSKIDAGVYHCRVDFFNSPTRNFRVNVTLIGMLHSRKDIFIFIFSSSQFSI